LIAVQALAPIFLEFRGVTSADVPELCRVGIRRPGSRYRSPEWQRRVSDGLLRHYALRRERAFSAKQVDR